MGFSFLKKETFGLRTQETFIGKKCEIFIPKKYFSKGDDNAIATELGERIRTMGLFMFKVDDVLYELQLPLKFEFQFSESYSKKLRLKPNLPEIEYNVFVLERGDAFVYDILHKKDSDDFTLAFYQKIIENARVQETTKYSNIFPIFLSAMNATENKNLGVSAVSIEFLISELLRTKGNLRDPYRFHYNGNEYGYKMVRITKIPELNSTFTSLIGEDIQNQLASSILRYREGHIDPISPVESVIKY